MVAVIGVLECKEFEWSVMEDFNYHWFFKSRLPIVVSPDTLWAWGRQIVWRN